MYRDTEHENRTVLTTAPFHSSNTILLAWPTFSHGVQSIAERKCTENFSSTRVLCCRGSDTVATLPFTAYSASLPASQNL